MGDTDSHRPMLECYDNCACDPVRFGNRVVQAGPVNNLQVVEVGNKGWGVRAGVNMRVVEFVCEYAGEVIGEEVAKARAARQGRGVGNYIMVLWKYAGDKTIVDPTGDSQMNQPVSKTSQALTLFLPIISPTLSLHTGLGAKSRAATASRKTGVERLECAPGVFSR